MRRRLTAGTSAGPRRPSAAPPPPEAPPPRYLSLGPEALRRGVCGTEAGRARARAHARGPSGCGRARAQGPRAGLLAPAREAPGRSLPKRKNTFPLEREGTMEMFRGFSEPARVPTVAPKKRSAPQNYSQRWEKREVAKRDGGCDGTRQG